jgi:hypothetical protein
MNIITRRNFILSLLLAGSISIPYSKIEISSVYSLEEKNTFLKIYDIWIQRGLGDPLNYIKDRSIALGMKGNMDKVSVNKVSQQDFCDGALFEVDGLILSRFEAAVMAQYGKVLV